MTSLFLISQGDPLSLMPLIKIQVHNRMSYRVLTSLSHHQMHQLAEILTKCSCLWKYFDQVFWLHF